MKRLGNIITVRVSLVIFLAFLITFPLGCSKKQPETKEIKIGAILPLTGDAAQWGKEPQKAIELAIEELNNKGGVNGKKIIVMFEDSQAFPEKGVAAIKKLIVIDKVEVVIGAISSSVTLAIAPIAEQNRKILISPASTSAEIADAGDYIFRTIAPHIVQASALVETVVEILRIKEVAVLYLNNAACVDFKNVFRRGIEKKGGSALIEESGEQGASDFRTQLTKMKEKTPKAILIVAFPKEIGIILRQAKEMGIDAQFLSPDPGEDPEVRKIAGTASEGLIISTPTVYPEFAKGTAQVFVNKFRQKYKKDPGMYAANAYDAAILVIRAIEEKGYNSDGIKQYLYSIKDFDGASGTITFDRNGDTSQPPKIMIIREGKIVPFVNN